MDDPVLRRDEIGRESIAGLGGANQNELAIEEIGEASDLVFSRSATMQTCPP